ncbi:MAG: ion transporter [Spirochaetes bacterium]|nr:ion transporter [Spirochaetota bacterium]
MKKLKLTVFKIIEKGDKDNKPSIVFDYFLVSLILLNVIAIIIESHKGINQNFIDFLKIFEIISVIIFSLEYILRLWTSEYKIQSKTKFISLLKYIITPIAMIDLFAILPFYLPMVFVFDLRFIRVFRLIRIFRLFKIGRYSKSLDIIRKVFNKKKSDIAVTVYITFLLLLVASILMFYIEGPVQPKVFSNILDSFWWAIATLTTIGYGDIYPITALGKFISGIIALLGIGLVALPTGIISSGFISELNKKKKSFKCPHCDKLIHK